MRDRVWGSRLALVLGFAAVIVAVDAGSSAGVRARPSAVGRTQASAWFPSDPAWSPNGRKLTFTAIKAPSGLDTRVDVMNVDGSGARVFTARVSGSELGPAWSPDGSTIAFARDPRLGGNRDIYTMRIDGTGLRRLTTAPEWDQAPAWSPDGRKLAFTSLRDGNQEIYVMDADGRQQVRLTRTPQNESNPKWSPDGRQLLFVTELGARSSAIEVMREDGSGRHLLTSGTTFDGTPAWSPDGRTIVFARSGSDGTSDLYVMNANGSDQRRITRDAGSEFSPTWSPDGARIAYVWSPPAGRPALYVVNADGTDRRKIVPSYASVSNRARVLFMGHRDRSVAQGAKFHFAVEIKNPAKHAISVETAFALIGPHGGKAVPFTSSVVSLPAGGHARVAPNVTPSQWFRGTGRFRIRAMLDGRPAGRVLAFQVGAPSVVVPRFRDVTKTLGLTSRLPAAGCGQWAAGAAWGDVNGDGLPDLYLPRRGLPAQLWINHPGGHFTEEAAARGVANAGRQGTGASFADYNNDGALDLYVTNDGQNRLYRNDGHGYFTDVAKAAGVADDGPSTSASWADYDNDGHLDLYVTDYVRCSALQVMKAYPDHLYHNNGNGTFTDVTALLGTNATLGAGFQTAWFDYNGDGRQDLYLANDFLGSKPDRNHLWRNDGRGPDGKWRFTDVSVASGTSFSINTMGIAVGDYNGDGRLDFALSNIESNKLLRNNGNGTFTDVGRAAGVARPRQRVEQKSVTWGTGFWDLNLDGREDLYFAAGHLGYPEPQANELFVNANGRKFMDLSAPSRADDRSTSRGVAFADYNRDGRIDMYVVDQEGTPRLFENVTPRKGRHWLEVKTVGTRSNRQGCGAWVVAHVGGRSLVREVFCGSTSLSSGNDSTVHFGLGRTRVVKRLVIRWPAGETQVLKNVKSDHLITAVETASR